MYYKYIFFAANVNSGERDYKKNNAPFLTTLNRADCWPSIDSKGCLKHHPRTTRNIKNGIRKKHLDY